MKRILIYGSFDFFHEGHKKLLERAKLFGGELYIGVSSENFNLKKGKKTYQSLNERIKKVSEFEGVKEIFIQNSFEQKEEDIKKYKIDILISGDDWKGNNDHLKKWCEVIYLPRTKGISSSQIREELKNKELCLKEIQVISLEILKIISKICEKEKINYWLTAGSLLGAIRHRGFIPWDDDIDIGMTRTDFNRFINIIEYYLPEHYEVKKNFQKKKRLNSMPLIKIFDKRYNIEGENKEDRHIFIDISPYDKFSHRKLVRGFQKIPKFIKKLKIKSYEEKDNSKQKLRKIYFLLSRLFIFIPEECIEFILSKWQIFINREGDKVLDHCNEVPFTGTIKIEDLYPLKKIIFESEEFYVPNNPIPYLEKKYGNYKEIPSKATRHRHIKRAYKNEEY